MKRIIRTLIISCIIALGFTVSAYAETGDMGFWGGISEGRKLPKTTEIILADQITSNTADRFVYKELLLLSGRPVEFEGTLTKRDTSNIEDSDTSGTYTVTYTVTPLATSASNATLNRSITFDVNYRREGKQIIKDYTVRSWSESISSGGGDYVLDLNQSHFSISILEDYTPGVTYYKGNISMTAVYIGGSGEGGDEEDAVADRITVVNSGTIYGYSSAWSSTETHRIDTWVYAPTWQMQYQLRPSVSVNKIAQYTENEPTAISFRGNYMEIIQNQSGLSYTIFQKPISAYDVENAGSVSIPSYNSFEQLIAPDTSFLKGHFAEGDISKLFSMQVLTGEPAHFQPSQAITRGQFVQALVKAIKLPIEETTTTRNRRNATLNIVFPDVLPDRQEYPYIMAAFHAGLAIGRDNGNFFIDSPIQREEAVVILVRALGLEQLGIDPTPITPFTDDKQIASWARREIYAANVLGIVSGDEDGNFSPKKNVTKAEGAALVNRLINYMRQDLVTDYTEHIINIAY